jgi:hypothetical protein
MITLISHRRCSDSLVTGEKSTGIPVAYYGETRLFSLSARLGGLEHIASELIDTCINDLSTIIPNFKHYNLDYNGKND